VVLVLLAGVVGMHGLSVGGHDAIPVAHPAAVDADPHGSMQDGAAAISAGVAMAAVADRAPGIGSDPFAAAWVEGAGSGCGLCEGGNHLVEMICMAVLVAILTLAVTRGAPMRAMAAALIRRPPFPPRDVPRLPPSLTVLCISRT